MKSLNILAFATTNKKQANLVKQKSYKETPLKIIIRLKFKLENIKKQK
jgi:hypothetical protein